MKGAGKPAIYVALFRGVNVTGNNMLPMKELPPIFEKAGCSAVKTYIQSGNVVFAAPATGCDGLTDKIQKQIEKKFGHRPAITLRTLTQMRAIVKSNPYLNCGLDHGAVAVTFLVGKLSAANIAKLDPNRSPGDEFAIVGNNMYLKLGNGFAKTKLTSNYFDSKLGVQGTARNWRTTVKLLEMMEEMAKTL